MDAEPQAKTMQRFESVNGGIDDCNADKVYPGPERRAGWHEPGSCVNMRIVEQRFADGTARMNRIEAAIAENKKAVDDNTAITNEIRDILAVGKSFFKMIDLFGRGIKWVAAIAMPLIGIWYTIKSGGGKMP